MEKKPQAKKFMLVLGILGGLNSVFDLVTYKGDFSPMDIFWLGALPLICIYLIYMGLRKETPKE